jgi:hypothetical protein
MERDRLHPRRTLDQYYYPSLQETSARDADQTLSKWTGSNIPQDGKDRAGDDSLLVMVDQLWCWVLDAKTILSFFPSHEAQDSSPPFDDLYASVKKYMDGCQTVWDLYSLLFREATTRLLSIDSRKLVDFVEIYRWVTSKKAASQTSHLEEFQLRHSGGSDGSTFMDDQRELKLVLEVVDIFDELKMIRHLVDKQRNLLTACASALTKWSPSQGAQKQPPSLATVNLANVDVHMQAQIVMNFVLSSSHGNIEGVETIKLLSSGVAGAARDHILATDYMLVSLDYDLEIIQNDALHTHKMLLDLLDLKQKTASLAEARATTQQGRVIMLFTVVTIIFV